MSLFVRWLAPLALTGAIASASSAQVMIVGAPHGHGHRLFHHCHHGHCGGQTLAVNPFLTSSAPLLASNGASSQGIVDWAKIVELLLRKSIDVVEDRPGSNPPSDVSDRLSTLDKRIDDLTARVDSLAARVDKIRELVEANSDLLEQHDDVLRNLHKKAEAAPGG